MSKPTDYPFEVRPLSLEEGGGFLISSRAQVCR
jgi:hypothetical protein